MIRRYDAWVLRRLLVGQRLNGELQNVSEPFRRLADHLAALPPASRQGAWEGFLYGRSDAAGIIKSLANVEPLDPAPDPEEEAHDDRNALVTTCLADIRPEPIRWLVPGYLPLGKLVILAGDGGYGKTTLTLHLAASVSRGRSCLGLSYPAHDPADVLLISCEDDHVDTVVPPLLSADADLRRIHRVDGVEEEDGRPVPFTLAYLDRMERELRRRPAVRLVV